MKKIMIILMSFITGYLYAENNNYIIRQNIPYGRDIAYTEEYNFYDDGLIKQIIHYDLKKKCDYYNWESIKTDLKILRTYEIERHDTQIIITKKENGSKNIVSSFIKKEISSWNYYNQNDKNNSIEITLNNSSIKISPDYVSIGNETAYLVDNSLIRIFKAYQNRIEEYKVNYDGNKLYTLSTNHPYGEDTSTIFFISNYINFEKESSLLNFYIQNFDPHIFFTIPTVAQQTMEDQNPIVHNNSIAEKFGYNYYSIDNNKYLSLKNKDLNLIYDCDNTLPIISGLPSNSKILAVTDLYASSALKEGKTEYTIKNIAVPTLNQPWVEGVDGNGIGEYIQFNKKNASGLYILNGFVAFSRPDLYEKNNRVEKISISGLSTNNSIDILLMDTAKPQYIDLSKFQDNEIIRLTINGVYNGLKYNDTCISGIILIK